MTNGSNTVSLDKKFIIPAFDANSNKKLNVCRGQFINWCRRTLNLDKDRKLKDPIQQIDFLKTYHKTLEQEIIKCFIIDDILFINQHSKQEQIDKTKLNLKITDLVYEKAWNVIMINYAFFENNEERSLITKERMTMWEEPNGSSLDKLHICFSKTYVNEMKEQKRKENALKEPERTIPVKENTKESSINEEKKEDVHPIIACLIKFMEVNKVDVISTKTMFSRLKLYFKTAEVLEYFGIKQNTITKILNDESISNATFDKLSEKVKPVTLVK